jgi:hypothetical protein
MCLHKVSYARLPVETRSWCDAQVVTHVALLPAIVIAATRVPPLLELVLLQSLVVVLSLIWHRKHERECCFAKVEHLFAHALFVYGAVQTWFAPTRDVFEIELICALSTLATYVATALRPELWETCHPVGLHVVPGVWSAMIAALHERLLF